MIVANTSPLYYLHQIDALDLCPRLFGSVYTTPHVLAELAVGKAQGLSIPNAASLEWLVVTDVAMPLVLDLVPDLGKGEASVIALAMEHAGSSVIIDDQLGRSVAQSQNLAVTGTLGVLLLAKEVKAIPSVRECALQLCEHGFYCSQTVLSRIVELAGETGSA